MKTKKPVKIRCKMSNVTQAVGDIVARSAWAFVSRSGYTVNVETPNRRYFFADSGTTPRTFGVNRMISNDITERAKAGKLWSEHANPSSVSYYNIPPAVILPESAYCVDIKAAYPTTLSVLGAISEKTFGHCMDLPKPERLKSVGMLASSRYLQAFEHGELITTERKDGPLRPYFFDVCAYVGNAMESVRTEGDSRFLLFWVDGAFLTEPGFAVDILKGYGYTSSVESVTGIKRSSGGRFIRYEKGGKSTYLCVPQRRVIDTADILEKISEVKARRASISPRMMDDMFQAIKNNSQKPRQNEHAIVEHSKTVRDDLLAWAEHYAPHNGPAPF